MTAKHPRNDAARAWRVIVSGALNGLRCFFWRAQGAAWDWCRCPGGTVNATRGAPFRAAAVLYALIALASLGVACEPRSHAEPPALPSAGNARAVERRPVFLWRAELGPSTLYLLGSVHVARAGLYPLDQRIEAAFKRSNVLVLELSLDAAAQYGAAQRMLELGRLPPGVRLADVLQPETWQLLVRTQEQHGISLLGLRGLRPWFVALAVTTQALERAGFSAENGIDEHFRRAAEGHKRIEALETVEEQLRLFTELSPEAQEHMLRETLEEIEHYGEQLDAAFDAWSSGSARALDELLIGPMRQEYPALFAQLFVDRNRRMTDKLLSLTKTPGQYFMVVGAGHLVGSGGIVDLLRARGIVTTQL
jgi:uncharacterized protein YbaP (TraB family)